MIVSVPLEEAVLLLPEAVLGLWVRPLVKVLFVTGAAETLLVVVAVPFAVADEVLLLAAAADVDKLVVDVATEPLVMVLFVSLITETVLVDDFKAAADEVAATAVVEFLLPAADDDVAAVEAGPLAAAEEEAVAFVDTVVEDAADCATILAPQIPLFAFPTPTDCFI
jgi:hypothetical protein